MRICYADFETYWAVDHSLSKMNPIAYVMHPKTEVISLAAKFDDGETHCVFGEGTIRNLLGRIDWSDVMLVGHNMSGFDAMIFAWRFGVKPKMWGCTLAMSRPFFQSTVGGSLKRVAEALGIGVKGDLEATNTKGKRLADFTPDEVQAMESYNKLDVDLCAGIFKALAPKTSRMEIKLIDATIRMLVEPKFALDAALLERTLADEQARKHESLLQLGAILNIPTGAMTEAQIAEAVKSVLASAPKFANFLQSMGVDTPMKPSPTNPDKQVPALAKSDEAFLALQEHDNELVAAAVRTRLEVKSTLLESRISQFLAAGSAVSGSLPIPLNYYAATTGRWGGWGYNPQNLPRIPRDKEGNIVFKPTNALRMSLRAPAGHKVVVVDLSGIELRVNHFLWRAESSTNLFLADPEKADLYKDFASKLYDVPVSEVSKSQRQLGKACIAEGELVLTEQGLVPIEQVSACTRVWDGVEWVEHDGPIYQGEQDVITYDSLTATPDHIVYLRDGTTCRFDKAAEEGLEIARTGYGGEALRQRGDTVCAARTAERAALCQSAVRNVSTSEVGGTAQPEKRSDARVPEMQSAEAHSEVARLAGYCHETTMHEPEGQGVQELRRAGGRVSVRVAVGSGLVDSSQPRVRQGEIAGQNRQQRALRTWEPPVGYESDAIVQQESDDSNGQTVLRTEGNVSGSTLRRQHSALSFEVVDRGTSSRQVAQLKVVQAKRRVWDLLNAGPRHRFTVNGRLVSNCQLGLGFGAGAATFVRVAKIMGGVDITEAEATSVVQKWRQEYSAIRRGWKSCGNALALIYNEDYGVPIDPWGMCTTMEGGIKTPVGAIRYPQLQYNESDQSFWYGVGRNRARLTGPKVDENIVQHLSRCIMAEQLLTIRKRYTVVHTVHDEIVVITSESEAESCLEYMLDVMRTPPTWWPEIALWAEGDIADSYGEAK
jgi:hypothetical protein